MMKEFLSVTALNEYIRALLEADPILSNLWVKGEISGFKRYQQSGHLYFTLKDGDSSVSAVMFKSRARYLKFKPEDGMEVLLRASVSVFARQGKYQLYAEEMQPYGFGGLFLYLEKLKAKLQAEGCFDPNRKKPVPAMVNRIGIVTSQDGAALRDIMRVIRQRHSQAEVVLVHSSVQGLEAPSELARGVAWLNEYADVEVIIVGRGGGSFEDLMAFNSEEVVRAIYDSQIPIISAVGHEVDFTLADLAADLRAATPTQAASLAVPDMDMLEKGIAACQQKLLQSIRRKIRCNSETLDRLMMKRIWKQPQLMIDRREEAVRNLQKNLIKAGAKLAGDKKMHLSLNLAALDALSPLKIMQRGYAVVSKDNKIVRKADAIEVGDQLKVELPDAELKVVVKDKEKVAKWRM